MKVLTIKFPDKSTVAVSMLNPGEFFPDFGGSRSGLVVGKTASLITSRRSPMGTVDRELDIHDPEFWAVIAKLINGEIKGATATAEGQDE